MLSTVLASPPGSGLRIEPWLSDASRAAVRSFRAGTSGAGDDQVIGVADGDDVGDGEGVAAFDEQLLHDFERGAFALHDPGQGHLSVEISAGENG